MIIVGAGIIGLSAALECQRAGRAVTIFDPDPVSGASHVAGGMLAPVAEVQYQQEALYPMMVKSAQLWPGLLATISSHTHLPTGAEGSGTLVVAADRADGQRLRELTAHQVAHGMSPVTMTVREARRAEPALSPALSGAVSIPGDTQVNPRTVCAALIDALNHQGVDIRRQKVTSLIRCGDKVTEIRLAGTPEAYPVGDADVVVANGLGAADVTGVVPHGHRLPLRAVYGDVIIAKTPAHRPPLLRKVVRGLVEGRGIYLIPRSDNQVLIGATSREDSQDHPPLGEIFRLMRDAIRIMPGIEDAGVMETLTGARPGTPDDLPYLGLLGKNLIIATGFFRHGIVLAALSGRAIALRDFSGVLSPADPMRHLRSQISTTDI